MRVQGPSAALASWSKAASFEPCAPVNTTPLDTGQSDTNPSGLAKGSRSRFGGAPFVPGVTRQRKHSPGRLAKSSPFSDNERALLEDFLGRCDLIKFARYDATTHDSHLLLEEATQFVKGVKLEPA